LGFILFAKIRIKKPEIESSKSKVKKKLAMKK